MLQPVKISGRVIGFINPVQKIFRKLVKGSRHTFKKFDAWGIDAEYFTKVLLPTNYEIRVKDEENGSIYVTTAEEWNKYGHYFHFKEGGVDHKSQIFLPKARFKRP